MDIGPLNREEMLEKIWRQHAECASGLCQQHWLIESYGLREARRNVSVADVLNALRTLDDAAGDDSNHFRCRVRMFVDNQRERMEGQRIER